MRTNYLNEDYLEYFLDKGGFELADSYISQNDLEDGLPECRSYLGVTGSIYVEPDFIEASSNDGIMTIMKIEDIKTVVELIKLFIKC